MYKNLNLIVACQRRDWGIGYKGRIPWRAPRDLEFFRSRTSETSKPGLKNAVIMGRKTSETLRKKKLSHRVNYVVTRDPALHSTNSMYVKTLDEAISHASNNSVVEKIYIIGGEEIYNQALNEYYKWIDRVYVTLVGTNYQTDRHFCKDFLEKNFDLVSKRYEFEENNINLEFREYRAVNYGENQYLNLVDNIVEFGEQRVDRTGTGTISMFGSQMVFDISTYFPLLTTKKMAWETIIKELLWFISGKTDATILQKQGVHIWDGNSSREFLDSAGLSHLPVGDIGAGYPHQWRHFGAEYTDCKADYTGKGVDQIAEIVRLLRENPTSRRIILSAWNPAQQKSMALPACHTLAQFYVRGNKYLDCQLYQRSGDMGLGVPFNIASYSMLVYILAHVTGLTPGRFIHTLGDSHIYNDHIAKLQDQLNRVPFKFPRLQINRKVESIDDFKVSDFELVDYEHHPAIPMKMSA